MSGETARNPFEKGWWKIIRQRDHKKGGKDKRVKKITEHIPKVKIEDEVQDAIVRGSGKRKHKEHAGEYRGTEVGKLNANTPKRGEETEWRKKAQRKCKKIQGNRGGKLNANRP